MNRKTFLLFVFVGVVCSIFTRALSDSPNDNEAALGMFLSGILITILFLSVHLRCNDIKGHVDVGFSIGMIILACIPLAGFIAMLYLIFTGRENGNIAVKNDTREYETVVDELQEKYRQHLTESDILIDSRICNDLYEVCNRIPSVKKIMNDRNIGLNEIIKFYRSMKCDDVLWDDSTGKYLPFVAILNPKTLSIIADNGDLPDKQLKQLVSTELRYSPDEIYTGKATNKKRFQIFEDSKKIWIFIFLIVSVCMMLYPPYHTVIPNKGEEFAGYNVIGTIPPKVKNNQKKFTSVDYNKLAFHEIILAVFCGAGCTLTLMFRKK